MPCNYMTPATCLTHIWPDFGWINPKDAAYASETEYKL